MKKVIIALLVACAAYLFWMDRQADVEGAAYVTSGSPESSLSDLLTRSREENKPLILLFTGSSWCPPCKPLGKAVLTQPEWERFVREDAIFVVYDFPRSASAAVPGQGSQFAQKFRVEGFPTLMKLDVNGHVLDRRVGYGGGSVREHITWATR